MKKTVGARHGKVSLSEKGSEKLSLNAPDEENGAGPRGTESPDW